MKELSSLIDSLAEQVDIFEEFSKVNSNDIMQAISYLQSLEDLKAKI